MTWQTRAPWARSLTAEAIKDALYCCAPVGIGELTQHLHARGYEFTPEELSRVVAACKEAYGRDHALPGVGSVRLLTIAGHGL